MKFALAAVLVLLGAQLGVSHAAQTNAGAALAVLATGDADDPQLVACAVSGRDETWIRLWSPRSKSWRKTIAAPKGSGGFASTLAVLPRGANGDALLIAATPQGEFAGALYVAAPPAWTPELVCVVPPDSKRRFGAALAVREGADGARVLVGAPALADATDVAGEVHVVSFAQKRIVAAWKSPTGHASFSSGVVTITDANSDGRADVLVTSPGTYRGSRGELVLVSSVDGAVLRSFEHASEKTHFTSAVAFVAGTKSHPPLVAAATFQWIPSTLQISVRLWDLESGRSIPAAIEPRERDGKCGIGGLEVARAALTTLPDVTGDGVDDLLVGYPDAYYALVCYRGGAWILSGADGSVKTMVRHEGDEKEMGCAVAAARSPFPIAVVSQPDYGFFPRAMHLIALDSPEGRAERIRF